MQEFMVFMSLFNRAIAELLLRFRETGEIRMYHALDYHGALAPIYLEVSKTSLCSESVTYLLAYLLTYLLTHLLTYLLTDLSTSRLRATRPSPSR